MNDFVNMYYSEEEMVNVSPLSGNLVPSQDEDGKNIFKDNEISSQSHDFNEDSLYGLLVLPVVGIALSTLAIILRRYQVQHDWRCLHWLHRRR